MATITLGTTLTTIVCAKCGITFAAPESWVAERRADHASFVCPSGHPQWFPDRSEAEKLRDELTRAKAQLDQRDARIRDIDVDRERVNRSLRGTKAVVTRMKRRVVAGRCVCCSHLFKDLQRHMRTRHPGFDPDKAAEALSVTP